MKLWPTIFSLFLGIGLLDAHGATETVPSVCERTPQVRDAIAAQLKMPCDQIGSQDLKKIQHLKPSGRLIERLHPDDFLGLDNLEKLDLNGHFIGSETLTELSITRKTLLFLPASLKELHLRNNGLRYGIDDEIMKQLPNLEVLDIRGNGMRVMPALKHSPRLRRFYAEHNQLGSSARLNDPTSRIFTNNPALEIIDLRHNGIRRVADNSNFSDLSLHPKLKFLLLEPNPFVEIEGIPKSLSSACKIRLEEIFDDKSLGQRIHLID